ncbi:6-aminohexanoate hydrolase [Alkalihalobacillus sp. FSL R5-0424]
MIKLLDNWMIESTMNFNIVVGITMAIYSIALIIFLFVWNKIGERDERTIVLHLKIVSFMFFSQIFMNTLFITWVDQEIVYFRQFILLFQGLVILAGSINGVRLYKKEFKAL